MSSRASTVKGSGRCARPGTFDSPSACCTLSGLRVSVASSKPDSWQPAPAAARAAASNTRSRRIPLLVAGRRRGILPSVRVIALFGPTGVGKTAVAIALAERLREGR